MGKSLIIKGADFSSAAIVKEQVSIAQVSLETNHYYNISGNEVSVEGITSIAQLEIPDGVEYLYLIDAPEQLEPNGMNCFDSNGVQIQFIGYQRAVPYGTHEFYELPEGTKYISYVYKNNSTYVTTPWNIGLNLKWVGTADII